MTILQLKSLATGPEKRVVAADSITALVRGTLRRLGPSVASAPEETPPAPPRKRPVEGVLEPPPQQWFGGRGGRHDSAPQPGFLGEDRRRAGRGRTDARAICGAAPRERRLVAQLAVPAPTRARRRARAARSL